MIAKLFFKNGYKKLGYVITEDKNEITVFENNILNTFLKKHISKITRLSGCNKLERDTRRKAKRLVKKVDAFSVNPEPQKRPRHTSEKQSFLYMIDLGYDCYKIGRTINVEKRMHSFKTASLKPIELIRTQQVLQKHVNNLEYNMKAMFAEQFERVGDGTEVFSIPDRHTAIESFKECCAM